MTWRRGHNCGMTVRGEQRDCRGGRRGQRRPRRAPHGPWAAALSGAGAEALSGGLLAAILVAAVIRSRWLPEAAVAVPAAVIVIVTGALPLPAARAEAGAAAAGGGFLAAVLVLGQLCESEGLFSAAGARLARWSRTGPFGC